MTLIISRSLKLRVPRSGVSYKCKISFQLKNQTHNIFDEIKSLSLILKFLFRKSINGFHLWFAPHTPLTHSTQSLVLYNRLIKYDSVVSLELYITLFESIFLFKLRPKVN